MKAESIVFAVAGMCFGVILGWVIASQQAGGRPVPVAAAQATAPAATQGTGNTRQPPPLDDAKVQGLATILKSDPKNAGAALQLANTYFDAERYTDAIKWYEQALQLKPDDPDASTDLGVSYYYTGQADRALQQFDKSLKLNPKHTKTMLNQGIVLAFGKRDLAAAAEAWKKVVDLAPESPEGQAARRGLEGIASASGHPTETPATPGT
jgi:cytochrome c-type biogenesis protein CcmH/NrfG